MSTNLYNPADRRVYPERWPMYRGKQLFRIIDERSEEGEEELLSVSHITGITPRSQKNVTMFKAESLVGYKKCQVGDIAANTMWTWQGAIGVSAYAGVVSPAYNVYRQNGDYYNPRFLDMLLRERRLVDVYHSISTGIRPSRLRLYPDEFLTIYFPVPPKDEQDQIVRFLDWKLSLLNKLITYCKSKIALLKELKIATINSVTSQEIHPTDNKGCKEIIWCGSIPDRWDVVKLKRVVSIRNEKGCFDPKSGDKYIGLENIIGYSNTLLQTDTVYEPSDQFVCRKGDLAFGKLRPYLAKVISIPFDAFCTGELLIIKSFRGNMDYLRYVMLNEGFIGEVVSSTYGAKMPRASADYILNMDIPIPSIDEQEIIVKLINENVAKIEKRIILENKRIDLLRELKTKLISDVISGNIDIRGVVIPSYEYISNESIDEINDEFNIDDMGDQED